MVNATFHGIDDKLFFFISGCLFLFFFVGQLVKGVGNAVQTTAANEVFYSNEWMECHLGMRISQ